MPRRHDLDWLRIGAFGLLIFYHIGMVFVPWDFHIKASETPRWIEAPMLLLNAWRLSLLFFISGVASRAMLGRGGFAAKRSWRLLVPLAIGIAIIVPPQSWVELTVQHGLRQGFVDFWAGDYWTFGTYIAPDGHGIILPTWNHLWFIVYLWVYSMVLAGAAALAPARDWQGRFETLFAGNRLVWLPILIWFAAKMWLLPMFPETRGLTDDWYCHLVYGMAFAIGVGMGGSSPLWEVVDRWAVPAALGAIGAWLIAATAILMVPEDAEWPQWLLVAARAARAAQGWLAIIALAGLARRWLRFDHRWRAPLNAAVFPAYIVHQTIIVVAVFVLLPLGLPSWALFVLVTAATAAGCALAAWAALRLRWLGPLLGVRHQATTAIS